MIVHTHLKINMHMKKCQFYALEALHNVQMYYLCLKKNMYTVGMLVSFCY